jgi:hypothetical protein
MQRGYYFRLCVGEGNTLGTFSSMKKIYSKNSIPPVFEEV